MPEYSKKTVVELQEILKGRSLPHTGKKADLVARLTEADKSVEAKTGRLTLQHIRRGLEQLHCHLDCLSDSHSRCDADCKLP